MPKQHGCDANTGRRRERTVWLFARLDDVPNFRRARDLPLVIVALDHRNLRLLRARIHLLVNGSRKREGKGKGEGGRERKGQPEEWAIGRAALYSGPALVTKQAQMIRRDSGCQSVVMQLPELAESASNAKPKLLQFIVARIV